MGEPALHSSSESVKARAREGVGGMERAAAVVPQPRVGVAVFVVKGKSVLLGKRLSHSNACSTTSFALPGGHLEFGESFEECGVREVKEETGLDIENVEFLTVTNNVFLDDPKPSHYVVIFMRVVPLGSTQARQNLEPGMVWCQWKLHLEIELGDNYQKEVGGNVGASQKKLNDLERGLCLKKSAYCEEDLHFYLEEL
eukprot:TRINITY_DN2810_c0_g2_i6.p1 TRINITY_DN2810_c0_g2~~TRINITY_DN2810_c0_g2_i6.p1  ORF type:complete len:198 (+),score=40.87 TRINITY_DN2810_c0_g2_i6:124-717(+)